MATDFYSTTMRLEGSNNPEHMYDSALFDSVEIAFTSIFTLELAVRPCVCVCARVCVRFCVVFVCVRVCPSLSSSL